MTNEFHKQLLADVTIVDSPDPYTAYLIPSDVVFVSDESGDIREVRNAHKIVRIDMRRPISDVAPDRSTNGS